MPQITTTLRNSFKLPVRIPGCLSILSVLLVALGISGYWLAHAQEADRSLALITHILLLCSTFFAVTVIAMRNQSAIEQQYQEKHHAQNILYDIAASINTCRDLKELLNRFCDAMYQALDTNNISIWLVTENNWLEYIASTGINPEVIEQRKKVKLTKELSATLVNNQILHNNELVTQLAAELMCDIKEDHKTYYIPLHYQDRTQGVIRIKVNILPYRNQKDFENLLITLAKHLSVAIEKARVDQESRRMIIMQERSLIANELHDSLAQTLASLRFQVRVLDQALQPTSEFKSISGIEQVENSLDEAYTDLRELIAHCRTPINTQGLIPAVEKLISRFRKETGIHVLLQKSWNTDLPPNMEMHIFRIVQEAINNIRKHGEAHNVRLMFRCDDQGNHHVLVENDGVGFEMPETSDHPGKHLGLTIMRERAAHLGGKLRIESDPEEGTRIELSFQYSSETRYDPLQRLAVINK
jgi:two-component system nitrate/nitrite sensor histidine kinase NarX